MSEEEADNENPKENKQEGQEERSNPDLLDRNEIDLLMKEAAPEQIGIVYTSDGRRLDSCEKVSVTTFNFRSPAYLTESELRRLRDRHDKFAHYLSSRLSMFLQMEFHLGIKKMQAVTYEKFLESRSAPTFISLFKIDKLNGVGIIDINPKLAISTVNRMLGGKGKPADEERALTDIEIGLMDEILQFVLEEWCELWKAFGALQGEVIGTECDARFLQTSTRDAVMIVLTLDAKIGECEQRITISLPLHMIEPIIKYLKGENQKFKQTNKVMKQPRWIESYNEITVPLYAEWPAMELTVGDVLRLRPGDVFSMPRELISNTQVRLMNTPCFKGEVGVDRGHVSVKINRKVERE